MPNLNGEIAMCKIIEFKAVNKNNANTQTNHKLSLLNMLDYETEALMLKLSDLEGLSSSEQSKSIIYKSREKILDIQINLVRVREAEL